MEITPVNPPWESRQKGKHYYSIANTLFEIDEKYIPLKFLGRGAYGVVCSAYNRQTNEKVAIKKIANVFEYKIDAIRTLRELMLSRYIHHENLVYLKDVMIPANWWDFKEVYMVYELMDTDLDHIIRSPQPLSNDHCQFFMFQLLSGLKYIHSANVLHRDLKPGNILINGNCELKICDFGLARTAGEVMTEYVVTRWYRAPELLLSCGKYGSTIDMWSVGCIFAEILRRKPIFPGKDGLDQIKLIVNLLGSQADADLSFIDNPRAKRFIMSLKYPNESCLRSLFPSADPLAVDLLEKMLVFDPSKRITVSEALCHPYMSDLYDPKANPPAEHRLVLDLDDDIEESAIREMMLQEILRFHPESAYVNLEC